MPEADRLKWNDRYSNGDHAGVEPSAVLVQLDPLLPRAGRAIDVAGGAGRHSIWLARRGLEVTLADISSVGRELAGRRAAAAGVTLGFVEVDLELDPFPAGPWDLILSCFYLHRPLYSVYPRVLAPGGRLVIIQPTKKNLERHVRPPAPFLLEPGELPSLVAPLTIEHYVEDWSIEGRHEAVLIARRGSSAGDGA